VQVSRLGWKHRGGISQDGHHDHYTSKPEAEPCSRPRFVLAALPFSTTNWIKTPELPLCAKHCVLYYFGHLPSSPPLAPGGAYMWLRAGHYDDSFRGNLVSKVLPIRMSPGLKWEVPGRYFFLRLLTEKIKWAWNCQELLHSTYNKTHTVGGRTKIEKKGILEMILELLALG
jgi:hypothetical protein